MSNQIVISSGAKVRELNGVLTGTSGVVNALGINVPSGIPQLDGSGKILVSQLPNSVMEYKGTWNAATNTPTLADGTGNQGDVYLCNVAGTVNFGSGPIAFFVGDQVIYSGTIWQRASGATGTVTSVSVTESGDALSITGSPITTSGTINIGFAGNSGQYVNGAGGLTTFPTDNITGSGASGQVTYFNGTNTITGENSFNYDASTNRLGVNTTVPNATIGANAGTDSGYSLLLKNDNANYNGIGFGTDSTYGNLLSTEKLGTALARNLTLLNQSGYISITEVGNLGVNILNPNTGLDIYNGTSSYLWLHTANSGITGTDGVRLALFSTNAANLRNFEGAMSITSEGDFSVITLGAENFRVNSADGSIYQSKVANALLKSVSGVITAAVAGTDYLAPASLSAYVPYTGATANVNLGTHTLSAYNLIVNHTSGSGVAASITKGGSGEALTVVKSSGSGNAASITGGVTLLSELNLTTALADAYIASAATWNAKMSGSGTSGQVAYFNGPTSLTSEAGFIYDASTNRLGVNTSVPNATIGADAALNSGYGLLIKTGASNYNGIGIAIDSTYGNTIETAKLGTASARNLTLLNQTGFISLTEAGNLGVNILTPNNGIDIYNSTQSQLWLHNNASGLTATDGVRLALFNNLSANLRNFDGGLSLTAEGDFQIITIGAENLRVNSANGFVGIGNPASLPSMLTVNGGATISGLTTGQVLFPTNGGTLSGTNSLFWDNATDSLRIGSNTSANRRLSIFSSSDANHFALISNAPAITLSNNFSYTYYATVGMATASNNFVAGSVAGDLVLGAFNTSSIIFTNANTNTQRMKLTSGGDLVIGATSADTKLDVRGEISLSYSADNGLRFYNQDRSNWSSIGNNTATGTSNANLVFRTSAGTALTIAANRNTTFATAATFSSTLSAGATTINGNDSPLIIQATTVNKGIVIEYKNSAATRRGYVGYGGDSSSLFEISNNENGAIDFRTNAAFAMRITNGGNVGIGTNSPSDLLHINGSGYIKMQIQSNIESQLRLNATYGQISNVSGDLYFTIESASGSQIFRTGSSNERMRIASNGAVGIGETSLGNEKLTIKQTTGNSSALYVLTSGVTAGQSYGLTVVAGTNSSDRSFAVFNQSSTAYFTVRGDGAISTGTASQSPYNLTTGNAANCYIESNGFLYRSTSSLKYKTDVKDYTKGLNEVLQLRPVFYKGKGENDGDKQYVGLIAEEVHDLGLTEFVQYAKDGTPDALAYQNMIALAFKAIQELTQKVNELESKIK
jgi:hypothetical protein